MTFSIYTEEEFRKAYCLFEYEPGPSALDFCLLEDMKYGGATFDNGPNNHVYAVALDGNKVTGVLKIKMGGQDSLWFPGFCNWVCFVTVHTDYQHQGVSKALIDLGFKWLQENGAGHILVSGYSTRGYFFTKDYVVKAAEKAGLRFAHKDKIDFPDQDEDGKYLFEEDLDKVLSA